MKEIINHIRKYMGQIVLIALLGVVFVVFMKTREYGELKQIISNLEADSRIAEVLVTESKLDEITGLFVTTIKFLEYGVAGETLMPQYFTFHGNQIQFQSLVVRFEDEYVEEEHPLKGKSIYLFLKAFVLNGSDTEVFPITAKEGVPGGYQIEGVSNRLQREIWQNFWKYALDPAKRAKVGIKNAQIEAPGSVFVPGTIYTIRIEHDGGMRIDTAPIPEILKGETITP